MDKVFIKQEPVDNYDYAKAVSVSYLSYHHDTLKHVKKEIVSGAGVEAIIPLKKEILSVKKEEVSDISVKKEVVSVKKKDISDVEEGEIVSENDNQEPEIIHRKRRLDIRCSLALSCKAETYRIFYILLFVCGLSAKLQGGEAQ